MGCRDPRRHRFSTPPKVSQRDMSDAEQCPGFPKSVQRGYAVEEAHPSQTAAPPKFEVKRAKCFQPKIAVSMVRCRAEARGLSH